MINRWNKGSRIFHPDSVLVSERSEVTTWMEIVCSAGGDSPERRGEHCIGSYRSFCSSCHATAWYPKLSEPDLCSCQQSWGMVTILQNGDHETMEWRTADTGQTHLIRGQNASSTSLSQVSQGFYGKVQFVISKKIYQSCYPIQGLSTGLVIRSLGNGHRSREIPKEDLDCNQITFNMHS